MKTRSIGPTLIAVGLVILFLAQREAGFMLFFLAIPLLPWLAYSLYVIATRPARRSLQATKAALWVLGVIIVVGIHYRLYVSTKAKANEVVNAIRKYASEHGSYPPNLEAIGLSNSQLRSKLHMPSGYVFESGTPRFFYASTYLPFHTEAYDFQRNVWEHVGD